ncbi:hypothetical protein Droror1_Dr00003121 [Drosera rotundifolia]
MLTETLGVDLAVLFIFFFIQPPPGFSSPATTAIAPASESTVFSSFSSNHRHISHLPSIKPPRFHPLTTNASSTLEYEMVPGRGVVAEQRDVHRVAATEELFPPLSRDGVRRYTTSAPSYASHLFETLSTKAILGWASNIRAVSQQKGRAEEVLPS